MLKNPNQPVIRRMAWNGLGANRRRTVTLFLAILLSAFLIFTVFTVGITYFKLERLQNVRMAGADFDAILYGVTEEQRRRCEEDPDILLTGTAGVCGWVEKTERDATPNVGLIWVDDPYWTQMMAPAREKLEGSYPTAPDELMVTRKALKECGYEGLGVGDTFTMSYGTYQGDFTGTFRISGIWDGYGPKKQFFVSKAFYDQSGWDLSDAASGRYYLDFQQTLMTGEEQDAFIESMELGKQQNLSFTPGLGASVPLLLGLVGLTVITCLCAYLLIYNIMYLSVAGRVRYYGLLQTVGMTEKQIKAMIRGQMRLTGAAGILSGCLLGAAVSFFLIPVVIKNLGIRDGYVGGVTVCFHPAVLVATVLLVALTIWLASRKPAKMAAAVSPIEALGYRPSGGGRTTARTGRGGLLSRLAWEQFTKDRKRTVLVLLSLAASLSVYLCLVTMLESQAARTIVSNGMDMDLVIKNDTVYKERAEDRRDLLDDRLVQAMQAVPGVAETHSMAFAEITVPWEPDFADLWMEEFYAKWMSIPYAQEKAEYQTHPEHFGSSLIGLDEESFDALNASLAQPLEKEAFLRGETCIVYRNGLDLSQEDLVGKTVTCALYGDREKTKTFTIAGVTDEFYYTVLLGYPPTILTSDRALEAFAETAITAKIGLRYDEAYDEETEAAILSLLEGSGHGKDFSYESRIEDAAEIEKAQGNLPEVGMGIVLILALIGVMNYMNTSMVNVQSRRVELSVMESVGMTQRQLLRMLVEEGLLYAGGAWAITLTAGLVVIERIYQWMNYQDVAFSVPLLPLLLAAAVSVLVCVVIPVLTWRSLERSGTVVERIRSVE